MGLITGKSYGYEEKVVAAYKLTASNSRTFTTTCHALYVGGAGNIAVTLRSRATTTMLFHGISAGQFMPLAALKYLTTSSTVSNVKLCVLGRRG